MAKRRRTYSIGRDARFSARLRALRCELLEPRRMFAGTAEPVKDILPGAESALRSEPILFDGAAYFLPTTAFMAGRSGAAMARAKERGCSRTLPLAQRTTGARG
jgi:hypothetical protein